MNRLKRFRGLLLRVALKRSLAIWCGCLLLTPAVWLLVRDHSWENPITDGLGLILGATGVAFVLAGLGGRRPDWMEPE
jgi:hypothetical protein